MINNSISLYAILRRILSELNEQVVDHGDRVAYLYLKTGQFRAWRDGLSSADGIQSENVAGGTVIDTAGGNTAVRGSFSSPESLEFENMMLASYAHDIGAYKTEKFLNLLNFDIENTLEHSIYGYLFMKYFSPMRDSAEVLLYHHTYYTDRGRYDSPYVDEGILMHLLDRVDIFNLKNEKIEDVLRLVQKGSCKNFNPRDVEDFLAAQEKFHLLEALRDGTYRVEVRRYFNEPSRTERLLRPVIGMLADEIDFKSEQTVIHSITIAIIAEALCKKMNLSPSDTEQCEYASVIHDLGKIDIPVEIVEKQGKLTPEEYEIMKKHVVFTELIVGDLLPDEIVRAAVNHHERLDGSGYPRGLKADELSTKDRILQVADVAGALMQKRSYKDAMDKDTVVSILRSEAQKGKLDSEIIDVFVSNYDEITAEVKRKSAETIAAYEGLHDEFKKYVRVYADEEHEVLDEFTLFPAQNCNPC